MSSVAILGSNGFLGSPISKAFNEIGWTVYSLSRHPIAGKVHREFYVDLFHEKTQDLFLKEVQPDVVISTAWETEHGKFWTKESNYLYRDATLKFAEKCFSRGVGTFVGLGSMSEYGFSPGRCNAETTPLQTPDIYSKTKVETGLRLKEIGEANSKKTHWLRIFQAFGPQEKPQRFVPSLIKSLQAGETFKIQTPNYVLDWIHTEDIADATVFTILNDLNHFVDVGTGISTSVKEFSELACVTLGLDSSLLDYSSQIAGHERTIVVDPESEILARGWAPLKSLEARVRSLG